MTSELSVRNAVPFSASIALARAAHHVTECVMALVPLVTHTIHDIINGADFLMSWIKMKKVNYDCLENKYLQQACLF